MRHTFYGVAITIRRFPPVEQILLAGVAKNRRIVGYELDGCRAWGQPPPLPRSPRREPDTWGLRSGPNRLTQKYPERTSRVIAASTPRGGPLLPRWTALSRFVPEILISLTEYTGPSALWKQEVCDER